MTFQELKQLKNQIAVKTGLDTAAAARVIGFYNIGGEPEKLQAMINGDMSPVGPALVALGITSEPAHDLLEGVHTSGDSITAAPDMAPAGSVYNNGSAGDLVGGPDGLKNAPQRKESTQAHKRTTTKEKTITSPTNGPQALQNDLVHDDLCKDITNTPEQKTIIDTLPPAQALPTPDPDIITDPDDFSGLLPVGLYDDINAIIDNYCQRQNIQDRMKIHPLQWQGICYRIGDYIKKRGVLRDTPREKLHGGLLYDGKKLVALLTLYGVICSDFKQVAFTFNFQRFAGVSREYFNDYTHKGLSSARVGIVQKAQELQKASLAGAVTGGGSATVGNIFLSKALAGMSETVTIQHVTTEHAQIIDTVPDLSRAGLPGPV